MRTDKELAFSLRKQGKSYNEICSELHVAKSTLSVWFKGVDFSEHMKRYLTQNAQAQSTVRIRNLNTARGQMLAAQYAQAAIEAENELKKRIFDPLFTSAIIAYWGEGDKVTQNQVRLTNTDPHMIALFKNFLISMCNIRQDKIRLALFIYKDLDEQLCKEYWIKQTGLHTFQKTMVLPSRHKTKKLSYGICTIVTSNTYLKKKMLVWIDQLPKIVLNREAQNLRA